MSRLFAVTVQCKGIKSIQLSNIFAQEFGADEEAITLYDNETISLSSEIYLCGGETDDEAHNRLSDAIKKFKM